MSAILGDATSTTWTARFIECFMGESGCWIERLLWTGIFAKPPLKEGSTLSSTAWNKYIQQPAMLSEGGMLCLLAERYFE